MLELILNGKAIYKLPNITKALKCFIYNYGFAIFFNVIINLLLSFLLHATLLIVVFNFTKINKPNIKLNNSININLTNPINNKVKNAILEEIEILKKIEKKKPSIPDKSSKATSISKPSPKPIITTKQKIKSEKVIKKEKPLNNDKSEEFVSPTNKEKKKIVTKVENSSDQKIFEDYKEELKYIIQKKATKYYPRISLRKKEQGAVELLFTIDLQGNIKNIKIGNKTTAPKRLINSSKKTLMSLTPYKKNDVLKKINTFSIIIVYILD